MAAEVRFTALDKQCTGGPAYQGGWDADPTNATDCDTASNNGTILHTPQFEVFGHNL